MLHKECTPLDSSRTLQKCHYHMLPHEHHMHVSVKPCLSNPIQLLETYELAGQSQRGSIRRCSLLPSISPQGSVWVRSSNLSHHGMDMCEYPKHQWEYRGEHLGVRSNAIGEQDWAAVLLGLLLFIQNGLSSNSRDNGSGLIWNQALVLGQSIASHVQWDKSFRVKRFRKSVGHDWLDGFGETCLKAIATRFHWQNNITCHVDWQVSPTKWVQRAEASGNQTVYQLQQVINTAGDLAA